MLNSVELISEFERTGFRRAGTNKQFEVDEIHKGLSWVFFVELEGDVACDELARLVDWLLSADKDNSKFRSTLLRILTPH